ncbi:MAG: tRNA dihydrouridine(16) synthase DusC [Burkholderiales bacterium 28-67-8]|nr:MAG: tRNA dihydrouridine(16) synthase DusC [Burkholderiales bacterium 28-67-8]
MTLLLAPMEGLLDHTLRDILTRVGGIDRCVSEFIRISGTLLPERAFLRVVPELRNGGRTRSGVPVRAQLLGSDPVCLAENAARLAALGPHGIDLNFGCPAKVVNRHGGGAMLLDDPEKVAAIVAAVRRAVPRDMPVSAKMRLGNESDARAVECALAMAGAGADELVVHARTKAQAYRPPAYWERVADIRAAVSIPVVANGEIWNVADALRCRELSGCHALMLGRGMVSDPGLALAIVAASRSQPAGLPADGVPASTSSTAIGWADLHPLVAAFWELVQARQDLAERHRPGRLKQWLNQLRRCHPQAESLYEELRVISDPKRITEHLGEAGRSTRHVSAFAESRQSPIPGCHRVA